MDSEVSEEKRLQVYGAPLFLRSLTIRLEFETNGWKSFIIKTEERDPITIPPITSSDDDDSQTTDESNYR